VNDRLPGSDLFPEWRIGEMHRLVSKVPRGTLTGQLWCKIRNKMKEYQYQKQLFISRWIEGEDLIVYGIKRIKDKFKLLIIKENMSPEGGEWTFIYNNILNRLYISKDEINLFFTGEINPEILEELKNIMKEKQ
jgi:hypothetical protein